jgi:ABC-type branched-subunit amino acid transport system permease subunit
MVFGALMIIFMIFQPLGMAKIWENMMLKFEPKPDRRLTS